MKKITFLLFFFAMAVQAQWTQLSYQPECELKTVFFLSQNVGYIGAVGDGSGAKLLKTTDGGITWTSQMFANADVVISVAFTDADHGFLTTDNQNVSYRTVDGGENWTAVFCETNYPGKVYFKDSENGFYYSDVNGAENFSHSTDGGATWTAYDATYGKIAAIHFPAGSTTGYFVTDSGTLYKTTDDGANWNLVSTGDNNGNYLSLQFLDEPTGFKFRSGALEKTNDGGQTWNTINTDLGWKFLAIDANTGYLSGADDNAEHNKMYRSTNQFASFTLMNGTGESTFYVYINDFTFPTASTGYAISTDNRIYKLNTVLGEDENNAVKIAAFPNPVKDNLHFEGIDASQHSFSIYDLSGRLVSKGNINNNTIDVSALNRGLYVINIEGIANAKFEKQ